MIRSSVLKSQLLAIFLLCSSVHAQTAQKPKDEDFTELRKKIFGQEAWQTKTCKVVSRGLKDELKPLDPTAHKFIESVIADHKKVDLKSLKEKFHPRLRMTEKTLKRVFDSIALTYGSPTSFTVYRTWALNTVDGSSDLLPCYEDRLAIGPHYGYPIHYGIWIQVMGQKELGRIYASVVPARNIGWRIGAWHLQQWTHKSNDPQKWVELALDNFDKKATLPAYVKLDLAAKLLDGGGYVYPMFLEDVKVTKSSYLKDITFKDYVQKIIGSDKKLVYLSSIFARDGAGILIRLEVAKDSTINQTKAICESAAAALHKSAAKAELGGVKCSFIVPGESIEKEGRLGSRFISKSEAARLAVKYKTAEKIPPENSRKQKK